MKFIEVVSKTMAGTVASHPKSLQKNSKTGRRKKTQIGRKIWRPLLNKRGRKPASMKLPERHAFSQEKRGFHILQILMKLL
jgi:hypothetical protein